MGKHLRNRSLETPEAVRASQLRQEAQKEAPATPDRPPASSPRRSPRRASVDPDPEVAEIIDIVQTSGASVYSLSGSSSENEELPNIAGQLGAGAIPPPPVDIDSSTQFPWHRRFNCLRTKEQDGKHYAVVLVSSCWYLGLTACCVLGSVIFEPLP